MGQVPFGGGCEVNVGPLRQHGEGGEESFGMRRFSEMNWCNRRRRAHFAFERLIEKSSGIGHFRAVVGECGRGNRPII
jgi:hypothetical protein